MGISVARNPNRRQSKIPQSARRIGRGIQDRVGGAECGGRFTSNHQRTNTSAAVKGHQLSDAGGPLPPTRNARHFLQEVATTGRCRRGREPQGVCHARHIRGLSEEVDSATLAIVPASGCETGTCRTMAEITFVSTRQQGEDQEHHERPVQPRHSLGMGNTQPHYSRAAECETAERFRSF